MGGLRPVGNAEVARAARGADLLILKGASEAFIEGTDRPGHLAVAERRGRSASDSG